MSPQASHVLERLLRGNGLGWMMTIHDPSGRTVLPALLEQLGQVATAYRTRIGVAVPFTPEALEAEAGQNPHKVQAFLQALCTSHSAEMLVMVWRILQGLSIREVTMNYKERDTFNLTVKLARPDDLKEVQEEYRSGDINDAALLRHLGIATISGQPLLDGFYPLRLRDDKV
jgi:hypothetical protein